MIGTSYFCMLKLCLCSENQGCIELKVFKMMKILAYGHFTRLSEDVNSQAWLVPVKDLEKELLWCSCSGVVSHLIP